MSNLKIFLLLASAMATNAQAKVPVRDFYCGLVKSAVDFEYGDKSWADKEICVSYANDNDHVNYTFHFITIRDTKTKTEIQKSAIIPQPPEEFEAQNLKHSEWLSVSLVAPDIRADGSERTVTPYLLSLRKTDDGITATFKIGGGGDVSFSGIKMTEK